MPIMYFDHNLPRSTPQVPTPSQLCICFVFNNPPSSICFAHMLLDVRLSPGAWLILLLAEKKRLHRVSDCWSHRTSKLTRSLICLVHHAMKMLLLFNNLFILCAWVFSLHVFLCEGVCPLGLEL